MINPLYGDKTLPLQVLKSAAGWYIGRLCGEDDETPGAPYARDSAEYYMTESSAQDALRLECFTLRERP